ncbi:uncharacterized protein LOC132205653 [Neocloeon triangulifer]|uniref:uncharacterized protein LOC132205653 n=1 Tax=Neocloeon triangulifer TaxID=2078957 RepID=UPI00286F5F56|nr:uncharacterized protein LOC132205653 [Neocloeon triangulifer]
MLNQTSALAFCCTKFMDLLSFETINEMSCLADELRKRKLSEVQYWTSGDSDPCPKSYAWCSRREMIPMDSLNLTLPSDVGKKTALTIKIPTEGLVVLQNDEKKSQRKAICKQKLLKDCSISDVRCIKFKCSQEASFK